MVFPKEESTMDNVEVLQDEISSIEVQMDDIVNTMIEKYGRFLSLRDSDRDYYKASLISNYASLERRKEQLIGQLNRIY